MAPTSPVPARARASCRRSAAPARFNTSASTSTGSRNEDRRLILRRPHRLHGLITSCSRRCPAGSQPRGAEPRQGLVRDAGVHGQRRRARHAAPARGHAHPRTRAHDAVLPGVDVRAVRQGAAVAAERGDAVLPALALRRRQALRLLDHGQLPRGVRITRAAASCSTTSRRARRDLRDAQDHARAVPHQTRTAAVPLPPATSTRGATGATRATTSRCSGSCCAAGSRRTT
jgi:hypothetical protein